jgi:MFS family permease
MQATVQQSSWVKAWPALGACMLVPAVSNAVFISCFPLWVVPWVNEFHAPRSMIMGGFSVGNLVMGLAAPIVGHVLVRWPARISIALGGLALAGGMLLAALAPSIWEIIALYATLMAFGAAFTGLLPAQSVAVAIVPERAGAMGGLITLGISAGGIVIPILLTRPVTTLGWRPACMIAAAITLFTIVPASWLVLKGHGGGAAASHGGAHGASPAATQLKIGSILGSMAFWVPMSGIAPVMFVVGAVLTNSVAIAVDSGVALSSAGYLISVIALGGAIGSVTLGWLADKVNYRLIFAAIAAGLAASLVLLMGRVGLLPMAFAFAVVGFAGGGVIPLLSAVVVRIFGAAAFPRVMGMLMPGVVISLAIGPVVAGGIRDLTGSYSMAFAFCAGLAVLSGLSVWFFKVRPLAADLA